MKKYELVVHITDAYHNVRIRGLSDEKKVDRAVRSACREGVWDGLKFLPGHRVDYIDLVELKGTSDGQDQNKDFASEGQGTS